MPEAANVSNKIRDEIREDVVNIILTHQHEFDVFNNRFQITEKDDFADQKIKKIIMDAAIAVYAYFTEDGQ